MSERNGAVTERLDSVHCFDVSLILKRLKMIEMTDVPELNPMVVDHFLEIGRLVAFLFSGLLTYGPNLIKHIL